MHKKGVFFTDLVKRLPMSLLLFAGDNTKAAAERNPNAVESECLDGILSLVA